MRHGAVRTCPRIDGGFDGHVPNVELQRTFCTHALLPPLHGEWTR